MEKPFTLQDLHPGQSAKVVEVLGEDDHSERLLALGLLPGTLVEVIHEAPFAKDPMAIKVRGGLFALRREQAARVRVVV